MKRIGIEPGKSLDISKLDPVVRKALEDAPGDLFAEIPFRLRM
jgi:hypothetical protein